MLKTESKNELKEIDVKNRTCYYFDAISKAGIFNVNNILIDEKPYKNILVYSILYKSLIESKHLPIRFDKVDGVIRAFDGTSYLVLFANEKYDSIYKSIQK